MRSENNTLNIQDMQHVKAIQISILIDVSNIQYRVDAFHDPYISLPRDSAKVISAVEIN